MAVCIPPGRKGVPAVGCYIFHGHMGVLVVCAYILPDHMDVPAVGCHIFPGHMDVPMVCRRNPLHDNVAPAASVSSAYFAFPFPCVHNDNCCSFRLAYACPFLELVLYSFSFTICLFFTLVTRKAKHKQAPAKCRCLFGVFLSFQAENTVIIFL